MFAREIDTAPAAIPPLRSASFVRALCFTSRVYTAAPDPFFAPSQRHRSFLLHFSQLLGSTTAIRQGCASVTQLIRKPANLARTRKGLWGPLPEEHDYAVEEAVAVFGQDPRQYETVLTETVTDPESGRLKAVKVVSVRWIRVDGILMQEELPETEREIPADLLLIANGFAGCETKILDAFSLEPDRRGNLCLEGQDSHRTANERVFTAGDMRRGASLVVWAIAEGRATAREVDQYLTGYSSL